MRAALMCGLRRSTISLPSEEFAPSSIRSGETRLTRTSSPFPLARSEVDLFGTPRAPC